MPDIMVPVCHKHLLFIIRCQILFSIFNGLQPKFHYNKCIQIPNEHSIPATTKRIQFWLLFVSTLSPLLQFLTFRAFKHLAKEKLSTNNLFIIRYSFVNELLNIHSFTTLTYSVCSPSLINSTLFPSNKYFFKFQNIYCIEFLFYFKLPQKGKNLNLN